MGEGAPDDRLRAALAELPHLTREVLQLRRIEGVNYAAIAGQLDLSPAAVEQHIALAMLHLCRRFT